MAVVTYEVYGHDGDHWRLEARYKEHQRTQALEQATDMADSGRALHVKVVKERLTDSGEVNQQTVFKRTSGNFNPTRLVGQRAVRASAAATRAAEDALETQRHPATQSGGGQWTVIKMVGALVGAGAVSLTAYSGLERANVPWLQSAMGGTASLGIGFATFLGMAVLLAYLLLQNNELPALFTAEVRTPAAHPPAKGKDKTAAGGDKGDDTLPDPKATTTTEQPSAAAAEAPIDPMPPPPSADTVIPEDDIDQIVIEKIADHRRFAQFLAQSIWEAQTQARQGKPFTRRDMFATYLYIAGATNTFAQRGGWTEKQARAFVQKVAAVVSQNTVELRAFARHYEELLTIPSNVRMFSVGAHAAAAFLGNEAQAAQALTSSVDSYAVDDTSKAGRSSLMTLLLTEAHETQAGADQQNLSVAVMDLHDAVVRAAIEIHKGTEIRHTGHGILAGFDDNDAAMAAACDIAARTDENTREQPLLAHHVAIGIARSSDGKALGLPGIGATVHLLDLLAKFAGAGQIGVTETVAKARRLKSLHLFDAGTHTLGDFPSPFKLFYLGWAPIDSDPAPTSTDGR
jgi:hypothetical protein